MGLITSLPAITADQIKGMREALFEGFFNDPVLNDIVEVKQGIVADKQLIIFGRHTGLAGIKQTACPMPTNATWGFDTIEKTWQPKLIGDRFAECYQTFIDTVLQYSLSVGVDKQDITGTEIGGFIVEQLTDMIAEVYQRLLWFGDKGIVSGTGNNLAAGELKFFNAIDGIWAQVFDIVTANAARLSTTGLATMNAGVSYAAQKFTATEVTNQVVSKALDTMWYDADIRMRGMNKSDLRYYVTQSVADQLEKERKSISGIEITYNRQESGLETLVWNGIPVVPMQIWDRMLSAYFGDDLTPVKTTLPHRAILAPKANLLMGTEAASALGALDVWHSKDDAKMYAEFANMIDVKVALDHLVQVAY